MNIRKILWLALFAAQSMGTLAYAASGQDVADEAASQDTLPAPSALRMQPVEIVDATGFGRPIVAATAEIPSGWQTQGGVGWNRATNCVTNQLRISWSAASRDGLQVVEILPGFNWQVQGTQIAMNPCPALPLASVRDFLAAVVQQNRPGARILQYRDRPELVAQDASGASNPNVSMHQQAGQMLIAYAVDGGEVHEMFGTTLAFSTVSGNVMAGTGMVFAQRALARPLDVELGDRIAKSIRPNPQWLALMRDAGTQAANQYAQHQSGEISAWHNRQMAAISARGAADRAAISANTARDIAAINNATYQGTQATNDRIHEQTLEGIGEYDRYRGVDGGEVRSSIHGGDRVLQMSNGDAFSTSDPYLNPAGSTELERVP